MSIDLSFDGSTEARGRNGWFQLREGTIYNGTTMRVEGDFPYVSIWFYSKTYGNMPPILMKFHNPEELRTLICGLSKAYAQMITKEESPHAPGIST